MNSEKNSIEIEFASHHLGRLKNGNAPGDFSKAPRCGAKTRRGTPCQCPAMAGKRRCRLHGGKSTGPRTWKVSSESSTRTRSTGATAKRLLNQGGGSGRWLMGACRGSSKLQETAAGLIRRSRWGRHFNAERTFSRDQP